MSSYGFTAEDVAAIQARNKANAAVSGLNPVKQKKAARHKFKAKPTINDGIRFDSKLEASYYEKLKWWQSQGEVLFFLRQVPIHLPGGTKLVIDFQVFYTDGRVEMIDTKGVETPEFKIKRREAEAVYPFEIKVVKKGDF